MSFLDLLNRLSDREDFLLIGGFAVNLYGYSRETHDIDLLVQKSRETAWRDLLLSLDYSLFRDGPNFLQFTPLPPATTWPLDLMLVNDQTFARMRTASRQLPYASGLVRVPSVEHLIALKLHVLKQNLPHRTIKDFADVQALVEHNNINLHAPEIREIFARYGSEDLYRRLKIACEQ